MEQLQKNQHDVQSLHDEIIKTLSYYNIYKNNELGKQEKITKATDFFLLSDIWDHRSECFMAIIESNLNSNKLQRMVRVSFTNYKNVAIKLEVKAYVKDKICTTWKGATIANYGTPIRIFGDFINTYYPNISSVTEINLEEGNKSFEKYLKMNDYPTHVMGIQVETQEQCIIRTREALFLNNIYNYISTLGDFREEWDKDIWDIRNLPSTIKGSTTGGHYLCRFDQINNISFRECIKRYCKKRLLGNNKFKFSSASQYAIQLSKPLNFFSTLHPNWSSLKDLNTKDIEAYMSFLTDEAATKSSNPGKFIRRNLVILKIFLEDVQIYEWDIAPQKPIGLILHADFFPSLPKKSASSTIKYIPDSVLEQLVSNFNQLTPETRMVVLIMMQTGLRISDTLELKYDCIVERSGNYAIKTDIQKTSIVDHEIPIVGEFINTLKEYANHIKEQSTSFNNPKRYLFSKLSVGEPTSTISARTITTNLNKLAIKQGIVDEDGQVYRFKNHAFRHTFAVKMINNNMCLVLLQDVLGHASADMTLTYAKLVDETKQKEFKRLYKEGVFSYSENGLEEVDFEEKLKEVNWNWEWVHHKMNAINTPYGTCLQRANGGCTFASQPPCLTCQNGKPCKHLLISADDAPKYQIHINSTQELIKQAKINNRPDWIDNNQELLDLYSTILEQVKGGKHIFGNAKHLNK